MQQVELDVAAAGKQPITVDLRDGAETMPVDQRQELEQSSLRMLFPPFPLTEGRVIPAVLRTIQG
jgi:hypothetical protein